MIVSFRTSARRTFFSALAIGVLLVVSPLLDANAAESKMSSSGAIVTYSGLKVYDDGSSTLRVNLSKRVPVELEQNGKALNFLLRGANVQLRNNKNPLRAEHFKSNVMHAKLHDTKKGVRLSVKLRTPARPQHQMIRHAGGAILRIDIPPAKE